MRYRPATLNFMDGTAPQGNRMKFTLWKSCILPGPNFPLTFRSALSRGKDLEINKSHFAIS